MARVVSTLIILLLVMDLCSFATVIYLAKLVLTSYVELAMTKHPVASRLRIRLPS